MSRHLSVFIIFGCSEGDEGEDGAVIVKLLAQSNFKTDGGAATGHLALGCLVISSTQTACLCYADGVAIIDGDTLPSQCDLGDSSITLVAEGTQFYRHYSW